MNYQNVPGPNGLDPTPYPWVKVWLVRSLTDPLPLLSLSHAHTPPLNPPPGDAPPPCSSIPAAVGRLRPALIRHGLRHHFLATEVPIRPPNRARSRNPSPSRWGLGRRRCSPGSRAFFCCLLPLLDPCSPSLHSDVGRDGFPMDATPASLPHRLHSDLIEPWLGHAVMPPSLHSLLTDGGLGVVVVLLLTLLLCCCHRRDGGDAITITTVMHGCTSPSPTPT